MRSVVIDCNVLIAGIGWTGNPRLVLDAVFAGIVTAAVTSEVWQEYEDRVPAILAEHQREADPAPVLRKLAMMARLVDPAPLGKRRSRDASDDRYLAAALAADAAIVTNDRDLLDLGKPFGVMIITPAGFMRWLRDASLTS